MKSTVNREFLENQPLTQRMSLEHSTILHAKTTEQLDEDVLIKLRLIIPSLSMLRTTPMQGSSFRLLYFIDTPYFENR